MHSNHWVRWVLYCSTSVLFRLIGIKYTPPRPIMGHTLVWWWRIVELCTTCGIRRRFTIKSEITRWRMACWNELHANRRPADPRWNNSIVDALKIWTPPSVSEFRSRSPMEKVITMDDDVKDPASRDESPMVRARTASASSSRGSPSPSVMSMARLMGRSPSTQSHASTGDTRDYFAYRKEAGTSMMGRMVPSTQPSDSGRSALLSRACHHLASDIMRLASQNGLNEMHRQSFSKVCVLVMAVHITQSSLTGWCNRWPTL